MVTRKLKKLLKILLSNLKMLLSMLKILLSSQKMPLKILLYRLKMLSSMLKILLYMLKMLPQLRPIFCQQVQKGWLEGTTILSWTHYNSFMKMLPSITILSCCSRLAVLLGEGPSTLLNHLSPNKQATTSPKPKKGIAKKLIPRKLKTNWDVNLKSSIVMPMYELAFEKLYCNVCGHVSRSWNCNADCCNVNSTYVLCEPLWNLLYF